MKPRCLAAAVAAAVLALTMGTAQAGPSVSALNFTVADLRFNSNSFSTRGYAFSVTTPGLLATHLGIFDAGLDGLASAHELGLWTADGTLIASASIAAGTGALLQDQFRYVDITDVALPVGTYLVGATFFQGDPDPQALLSGISMAAGLQYLGGRVSNLGGLNAPNQDSGIGGLPGGTLMVAQAVPEPSSLALLGLGLAGLALRRRMKA